MLKHIFDAITPDNIKGIPLIEDAMEIFIKNLEEKSEMSLDIKKVYQSENEEIRKNLLKIYLNNLYEVLTETQQNKVIQGKIQESKTTDKKVPLEYDIQSILNDEYFTTSKSYKQKVGTKVSVDYAYNLTKYMETGQVEDTDSLALEEIKPFHIKTEGSIMREMYENVVKPLSHPIGFTYIYNQIIKDSITELFNVKYNYDVKKLEVRCLNGGFFVFTPFPSDTLVKEDFLSRQNILTGDLFTEEEYNEQVTVYTDKVITVYETEITNSGLKIYVEFDDNTLLKQYGSSPIKIDYRLMYDEEVGSDNYIMQWTEHCSIYSKYDLSYDFLYGDEIERIETTMWITKIKEDNEGNEGQNFYDAYNSDYGRTLTPISTSDNIVITSESYMTEDLLIYAFSEHGYYLNSEEEENNIMIWDEPSEQLIEISGFYMFSEDGFYLTTLGNDF